MLNTLQCHQPLPFRASVSTIVRAKLRVPEGSPDQVSAGEMFCPLQRSSTCASAIGLPLLTSGEDTVKSASAGVAASAKAARRIHSRAFRPPCLLPGCAGMQLHNVLRRRSLAARDPAVIGDCTHADVGYKT